MWSCYFFHSEYVILDHFVRIYSGLNDVGIRYKSQVRSRVANLGDLKNPGLRQAVINGHISPSKVATMKTEVCVCACVCTCIS